MVKLRRIFSNRDDLTKMVVGFMAFCTVLGLVLQALRSLNSPYPIEYFFINFIYFTTQSNILVLILLILHFKRSKNYTIYDIFIHIALLNIIMTGAVFHLVLGPYMELTLVQHILHTITPLLFLFYYFVIYDKTFKLKYLETLFIYPIVYTILVYTVIEPKLGDTLELVQGDFQGARYIYPFYDPFFYDFNILRMLQFFFYSTVLIIILVMVLTQPTKRYIERKINEDNPNSRN